jgi:hypothetical protein
MEFLNNPKTWAVILAAVSAAVGALETDRKAFYAQKRDNPWMTYDWTVAGARVFRAALYGAVAGLGFGELAL